MTAHIIRRALLSVSDKSGLIEFARNLASFNVELISTGGTYKALRDAGLDVREVSSVTQFPEMMDGRVKTLHPIIHGGLLAVRGNQAHEAALSEHDIAPIDLLVVNLYPFEKALKSGASRSELIENIDIGGPAMIRSAAKNHDGVGVVIDHDDYDLIIKTMQDHQGALTQILRQRLAQKAYARTAHYDTIISNWFASDIDEPAPAFRSFAGSLKQSLRYGENPHQEAAFYHNGSQEPSIANAVQIQGKPLSYNNINDSDAAFELISEFDPERSKAVAIIKHANPCGVAEGESLVDAYQKALLCDPVSAFGGIIALNAALDEETAIEITKIFTEVIIAPDASPEAKAIIAKKKNLRLLLTYGLGNPRSTALIVKSISGGLLVQNRDHSVVDDLSLNVVTKRAPNDDEMRDLLFAFRVAKHVKSNTILYAKNSATVGVGAGQMSRIDSARIAARKAEDATKAAGQDVLLTKNCIVASDAFFPFADGLLAAVEAGATAVIQPGGSMRDEEVIKAADDAGIAMVFTGIRHFKH